MRKIMYIIVSVCVLMITSACVSAESDMNVIKVNGSASVSVEPDQARIRMKVTENSASIIEAKKTIDKKVLKVQNMMIEAGLEGTDINAANFRVYKTPKHHPRQPMAGEQKEKIDYTISREITAIVKDLDQLDRILDAAIKIGANEVQGIDFLSSKEEELKQEALVLAAENAQVKAQALVNKFNAKLGDIILIQEGSGSRPGPFMAKSMMSASGFAQGEVDITAQVYVEFEIK